MRSTAALRTALGDRRHAALVLLRRPDGANVRSGRRKCRPDRWHSLQQSGAVLAFSSDWPAPGPRSPFVSIQETATRQVWKSADTANIAGEPLDGAAQGGAVATGAIYVPEERITVADAVRRLYARLRVRRLFR